MVGGKFWKLVGVLAVLGGIVIALIPFNLVHVCYTKVILQSGMSAPMKCNWMGITEVVLGVLIAINGLLILLAKDGFKGLGIMLGVLGVAVLLVPTDAVVGICANPEMMCHSTKRALGILGGGVILTSVIGLVASKNMNLPTRPASKV